MRTPDSEFSIYGWTGDYASFADALAHSGGGYATPGITDKKIERTRKILADGISNEVNAGTLRLMSLLSTVTRQLNTSTLRVLDLGGELGVHYFRLRNYLKSPEALVSVDLRWTVSELPERAKAGLEFFADSHLDFANGLSPVRNREFDLLFSRGAIQYFEDPWAALTDLSSVKARYMLLEALPYIESGDRLTIQNVPPRLYPAKLPCWFFNREKFETHLKNLGWSVALRWPVHEDHLELDGKMMIKTGILLKR